MIRTIKTKQFKITAFVLALVLTVSCITWNATRVHAQELEINNTSVQTFAGARAITNGKLVGTADASVDIGIFVTNGSAEKYNATNVKWTHDGSGWTGASSMLYEGVFSKQKISAYYPYAEGAASGKITVAAWEQTDWLVATSTDLRSSVVGLTMTHALTKLVLQPTYGSELTNKTIDKIEVGGMYASGVLNIADNTWSNLPEANTTLQMNNNELLVIPRENCTSFPVVITMSDGRKFTTEISLAGVNNKLAGGYQYNISLQVGQDKVTLGSITASPWEYAAGGDLETE